jgi:hypothetical protein
MIALGLATRTEKTMPMPGDRLVPNPRITSTHGITIAAGPQQVWPWVVQIGQGRAGFYSYTALENLLGCQMKNADRVHSEWQELKTGDTISIHPNAKPLIVAKIEPENLLVLEQPEPLHWTWSFCLKPQSGDTRLLIRTRVEWKRGGMMMMISPVMTAGHYVMERKMLTGIKSRVESATKCENG